MSDLIGKTVGSYEIIEELGQGGMAVVYKAYHPHLKLYRALKIIRQEFILDSQFQSRFLREAQTAAALRHPNIIQIHDFGVENDLYFMVMEYIEGEDLSQILKREGMIRPYPRIIDILIPLVSALDYAHKSGVVHRDIKPANIMINQEGQVILTDFGIAKLMYRKDAEKLTQTGSLLGTPAYMAPEQMQSSQGGPAADIYSLGVILYQLVTGHLPYEADTPVGMIAKALSEPVPPARQFNTDVSFELENMLLKAMAKTPEARYQSLDTFASDAKDGLTTTQQVHVPEPNLSFDDDNDSFSDFQPDSQSDVNEKTVIIQSEPKRPLWLWIILILIPLIAFGGWFIWGRDLQQTAVVTPAVVGLAPPEVIASATSLSLISSRESTQTATSRLTIVPTVVTTEPIVYPPQFPDYGMTGKGVTIVILESGIDWQHPDFINADGTTRIRYILDLSNQSNWCAEDRPAPIEYTAEQINNALENGVPLAHRDALGSGTAAASLAAGNGSALPDQLYRGLAPEADIIMIKSNSPSIPAHTNRPAESFFNGCIDDALDWVDQKIDEIGQPAVGLWNFGTQWGPIDGTSAISRKIDAVFGLDRPGRIWVASAGSEGGLPNHASGILQDGQPATINFNKIDDGTGLITLWYSGETPASITIILPDGTSIGPVEPGGVVQDQDGVSLLHYRPDNMFYPWVSTNGDFAIWLQIEGHAGQGQLLLETNSNENGRFDLYSDLMEYGQPSIEFLDNLANGRLTDTASTFSAITVGSSVMRNTYTDIDGQTRTFFNEGEVGALWLYSPGGPTRDGRQGIDVVAPGHNAFAALAQDSLWAESRFNQPLQGNGLYVRYGGTGAAASIMVGTIALMLEANPELTAQQVKQILQEVAMADDFTGDVPNLFWGAGKLDVETAVTAATLE